MSETNKQAAAFRVALVQMLVEGGESERNLARAESRIVEAAAAGADLVLLPETLDLGWTHPSALTQAESIPGGEPFQRLAAAAKDRAVYVCAGLTERDGKRVFNAAVLVDRNGELLIRHRKLNELEIGHQYYAQGDRLNVAETEIGTLGVMVCADAKAKDNVLSRALGYMGADVILSPSAWAKPADHDNTTQPYGDNWREVYCPVAREFALWFLSASNVGPMTGGPWQGYNCIGCSLVIDPTGRQVLQGPYGAGADTILFADVRPVKRPARGTLWSAYVEDSVSEPSK